MRLTRRGFLGAIALAPFGLKAAPAVARALPGFTDATPFVMSGAVLPVTLHGPESVIPLGSLHGLRRVGEFTFEGTWLPQSEARILDEFFKETK